MAALVAGFCWTFLLNFSQPKHFIAQIKVRHIKMSYKGYFYYIVRAVSSAKQIDKVLLAT